MELHHFNPELEIQDNAFAWRYMSITKLNDFLLNNNLYFSRLDTFDDPIEGIPFDFRALLQSKHLVEYEESESDFKDFEKKVPKMTRTQIENWQHATYSSCWYLTELKDDINNHHESLAMWNYLNGDDGFVIKINLSKFISLISDTLSNFNDDEIFQGQFGKVHYLSYGEYRRMLYSSDKNFMPALIKHNSYKFENELRFLLLRNPPKDLTKDRLGIPIKLTQPLNSKLHEIELFAHPKMSNKDFKKYRDEFKTSGFDLKISSILTKQTVEHLIE